MISADLALAKSGVLRQREGKGYNQEKSANRQLKLHCFPHHKAPYLDSQTQGTKPAQ